MDASDTMKKKKAITYYVNQVSKFKAKNPTGNDCDVNDAVANGCCQPQTNCNKNFDSYELKSLYKEGRKSCSECAGSTPSIN